MATITVAQKELDVGPLHDLKTRDDTSSEPSLQATQKQPQDQVSDEVAALSQKLVKAINLQTTLDDTLSETRHELSIAKARILELESLVARQKETLDGDLWIRKSSVEPEKEVLRARIRELKRQKDAAEDAKHKMEGELDTLATDTIAEAHKMVVVEKEKARDREDQMQQKMEQLRRQVADYEEMFRAQQEQIVEMKQTMDQMSERGSRFSGACPSSPGMLESNTPDITLDRADEVSGASIEPAHPLSYSHLIQPVLREDVEVFEEFAELAKIPRIYKSVKNPQQVPAMHAGAYAGFTSLGIGLGGHPYILSTANSSSGSVNMPSSAAAESNPQTPNTPASSVSANSTASTSYIHLKDTKFYRRLAAEDVDGTLRLVDFSWLTKRSITHAFIEGSVTVEPLIGPNSEVKAKQAQPCTLCHRKRHGCTHQFGVSNEMVRYPVCKYCLARVRATAELLSFLRMVKEGHWRIESDEDLMAAWEECTRLREQMFWARVGGGVVPAACKEQVQLASRRSSQDATPVPSDPTPTPEKTESKESKEPPKEDVPTPLPTSPSVKSNVPTRPSTPVGQVRERSASAQVPGPTTPSRSAFKRLSLNIPLAPGFFN